MSHYINPASYDLAHHPSLSSDNTSFIDYYAVLDIPANATTAVITTAYRRLRTDYFLNDPKGYRTLQAAFDCLIDEPERMVYDVVYCREKAVGLEGYEELEGLDLGEIRKGKAAGEMSKVKGMARSYESRLRKPVAKTPTPTPPASTPQIDEVKQKKPFESKLRGPQVSSSLPKPPFTVPKTCSSLPTLAAGSKLRKPQANVPPAATKTTPTPPASVQQKPTYTRRTTLQSNLRAPQVKAAVVTATKNPSAKVEQGTVPVRRNTVAGSGARTGSRLPAPGSAQAKVRSALPRRS